MEFHLRVHQKQHEAGIYCLHERRLSATSWTEFGVANLAGADGVMKARAHMCRYGMPQWTSAGWRHVRKPAGFLTNSPFVNNELNKARPGDHAHVLLQGHSQGSISRTKQAHAYPPELCRAICRGLGAQKGEMHSHCARSAVSMAKRYPIWRKPNEVTYNHIRRHIGRRRGMMQRARHSNQSQPNKRDMKKGNILDRCKYTQRFLSQNA